LAESLTIVIPVYNEGENIKKTVAEIEEKVSTPHGIIVVYDFDEDNTLPPARELIAQGLSLRLVKNAYGRGALNAIRTGIERVHGGAVLVAMGDLSDDMTAVDGMFRLFLQGFDVVCGSRYMKGGRQLGGPWLKGQMSRLAGLSLHLLAGIPCHDVTNSFKLYRKAIFDKIQIESTGGFELGLEITVKAHFLGFRVTEVPSTWRDRSAGQSRFRLWKWLPHYLHWYLFALGRRFFPGPGQHQ
jgi:glycosyltransferase involved in cell wall biosynthesis